MRKASSLLSEWEDSLILEQDEDSKNISKTEKLTMQKKQLAIVLRTLLEGTESKLNEYYQTDESLSEDEFLNPEKPYLVTSMIYAVLDEHPEFSGVEGSPDSDDTMLTEPSEELPEE